MTPLAHAIASDAALPMPKRRYADLSSSLGIFDDLHFFDVHAVWDLAGKLIPQLSDARFRGDGRLAFLPADRVWLECRDGCVRHGLLIERHGEDEATLRLARIDAGGIIEFDSSPRLRFGLSGSADILNYTVFPKVWGGAPSIQTSDGMLNRVYALLAMINSPRVIGRRQHMPHAGLQRRLAAARGMMGKFPLRAWSEIVLEVSPPVIDGQEHEARLTGGKALHFCRAHLRVQYGKLVMVTAHWRGDPALGIKQTRYSVVPGRANA